MDKYREIREARELLELPESATMKEIKSNYRELVTKWHPDRWVGNLHEANRMTRKILDAYKTIMAYCGDYRYSFSEEEVKKYLSADEWWFERFGGDPLWGDDKKPK